MKTGIKLITLLLMLALSLSLLAACDFEDILESLLGEKEVDVTLASKTEQISCNLLYAPGDEDAKEAASSFKTTLSKKGFPSGGSVFPSDAISLDREVLFGKTDREVSK